MVQNRQRKLFTNISGDSWDSDGLVAISVSLWSLLVLAPDHPAPASGPAATRGATWCSSTPKTFATLAMDPAKKKEIMDDLDAFRNSRDLYRRAGKPWKRRYHLYGRRAPASPP